MASDTSSVTLKSTDLLPDNNLDSPLITLSPIAQRAAPREVVNPWLVSATDKSQAAAVQKRHELSLNKDSARVEKSRNKLRKRVKKREEEKEKAKEDAAVDITMSDVITLDKERSAAGSAQGRVLNTKAPTKSAGQDDESDAHSEVDAQEQALILKGKGKAKDLKAFEQRDLVARAFAGDNVVRVRVHVRFSS